MITKDNFSVYIQGMEFNYITDAINGDGDYILMTAHIFNTGGYATLESSDYSEQVAQEAADSGNLFCDKDEFMRLLNETQALEY